MIDGYWLELGRYTGTGLGAFYHTAGTASVSLVTFVGAYGDGRYELTGSSAVLKNPYLFQVSYGLNGYSSTGYFLQTDGKHYASLAYIGLGWNDGGTGTYDLRGGTFVVTNYIGLGSLGSARTGTTPADGTFLFTGGTLTDGGGDADLAVRVSADNRGTFRGNGTVDFSGDLENNGVVTAVGGTLDMSGFASVDSTIENDDGYGWYAKGVGLLQLPDVSVGTGAQSVNWGEAPGDAEIDLVNSVNAAFDNVTGAGNLTVELVGEEHATLPAAAPSGEQFIGLWKIAFSGSYSGNYDLTLRYDDSVIGTNAPSGYYWNGSAWTALSGTLSGNRITFADLSSAPGLSGTPVWFALTGPVPPFVEDFEAYLEGDSITNYHGWTGSGGVIATSTAAYGSSFLGGYIPLDRGVTNPVSTTSDRVWTEFYGKLALWAQDSPPSLDSDATAMLYVNSNAYPVVYDGATDAWAEKTTAYSGGGSALYATGAWARVTLFHHYTNKTWALFMDNVLVAEQITFINESVSDYARVSLYGGKTWFDDLSVRTMYNSTLDGNNDGDSLVDAWEIHYLNTIDYGDADDPDGDGADNEKEQTDGTDPNNPASRIYDGLLLRLL
ncbi:MAG: hypothetical protein JW951_03170 [Lentisphaerae bacterium]|nr:hypothetical protein [Lentisphaerota bacterium]